MIAPTHIAFAVACGTLAGGSSLALKLLAAGALLPDVDHPQSALGRIFFFVSIPLNRYCGHRRTVHGFALWGAVATIGVVWPPSFWLGLGALSHIFLDALNISGVQALMPFSEKVCVLFSRKWRFVTGSKNELFLLIILGAIAWSGGYISSLGGIRTLVGVLTGSYQIACQQYLDQDEIISAIETSLIIDFCNCIFPCLNHFSSLYSNIFYTFCWYINIYSGAKSYYSNLFTLFQFVSFLYVQGNSTSRVPAICFIFIIPILVSILIVTRSFFSDSFLKAGR